MARSTPLPEGVNGGYPTPENPTEETVVSGIDSVKDSKDEPKKAAPKADAKDDSNKK